MTREQVRKLVKSILDKKIPCKMGNTEVPSNRLNHIIRNNAPRDFLGNLIFTYDHEEPWGEDTLDCCYNKTYDILVRLKVRYIINIGDPSRSHWKIVGYDFGN